MRADEIRELVELVERSGIVELEVHRGRDSIRIRKSAPDCPLGGAASAPPPDPVAPAVTESQRGASTHAPGASEGGLLQIRSPMVGTFFRASSPDIKPYIESGSRVSVGQAVCIVEAMKLMNEIESEVAGEIVRVLVENGQPVEFNQPLFLVRPD
jgi:acetyl-CoA carboxylase biotin carboxyl carrier protein